jgi:hypothetical protein
VVHADVVAERGTGTPPDHLPALAGRGEHMDLGGHCVRAGTTLAALTPWMRRRASSSPQQRGGMAAVLLRWCGSGAEADTPRDELARRSPGCSVACSGGRAPEPMTSSGRTGTTMSPAGSAAAARVWRWRPRVCRAASSTSPRPDGRIEPPGPPGARGPRVVGDRPRPAARTSPVAISGEVWR